MRFPPQKNIIFSQSSKLPKHYSFLQKCDFLPKNLSSNLPDKFPPKNSPPMQFPPQKNIIFFSRQLKNVIKFKGCIEVSPAVSFSKKPGYMIFSLEYDIFLSADVVSSKLHENVVSSSKQPKHMNLSF